MAKEAITKPDTFSEDDNGDAPVIELESREVKHLEEERDGGGDDSAGAPSEKPSTEAGAESGAARTEAKRAADGDGRNEATPGTGPAHEVGSGPAEPPLEQSVAKLITVLEGMREGRDAVSMRRDLVSLHDKLVPEIQASRDAARQSEAGTQSLSETSAELKGLLGKVDGSISELEAYLLVNLEERLQAIGKGVKTSGRSTRIPRWLQFAVLGNLLLTSIVLFGLFWPEQSRGVTEAIASFSIEGWLKSMEPRP